MRALKKIIWERIIKFTLPHNALALGIDVLKSISELLKEDLSLEEIFQV